MSKTTPRHRSARRAEVVARAAVVLGLVTAIGLLAAGGEPATEFVAGACNGAAANPAASAAL